MTRYTAGAGAQYAVVNVADDITVVRTGRTVVYAVCVNTTLSAHVLPIMDGATTVFSLPASAVAGTVISFPTGITFETSLVVDPNNVATGSVTVIYRAD
jgi:hypothetical protein